MDLIVCTERWDFTALQQIKTLASINDELRRQLERIRLSSDEQRLTVHYTTKSGDSLGRVYGEAVYHEAVNGKSESYINYSVSLQGVSAWVRRLVAHRFYRDFDIANCAPVLLSQILAAHQLACPRLQHYNENRDALFVRYAHLGTRRELKQLFLTVIHMGAADTRIAELMPLKTELRALLLKLSALNENYKLLYDRTTSECQKQHYKYLGPVGCEARVTKALGKFCAIVWNREEHRVLMAMRQYFITRHAQPPERMVLCFDGLMLERSESVEATVVSKPDISLEALSGYILEQTSYHVHIEEKSLTPTEQDMQIYRGEVEPPKKKRIT